MPEPTQSDGDLLRSMLGGEEEAFTVLYRRHQGGVYRFALQMSGNPEVAEETVQEVFMVLMRGAKGYDPQRGALSPYLFGIARNCVRRCLTRERAYVAAIDDPEASGDELADVSDILEDLTRGQTIEALRRAIMSLPANYREVVVLCDLEEMEYADAAGVLGCAVGTVRSRLHRARALLVEKLRARERCPA